ncbi:MAG: TonB C-terminal domain-containing protein [Candidatus Babeliaceae bacterium]|nr:TonB C-terminal domain-containing protein [Candidatus Babeliaceae bacterium]
MSLLQRSMHDFEREARLNALSWAFALYMAILWGLLSLYDWRADVVVVRLGRRLSPASVRLTSGSKKEKRLLREKGGGPHTGRKRGNDRRKLQEKSSETEIAKKRRAAEREAKRLRVEHEKLMREREEAKKRAYAVRERERMQQREKAAQQRAAIEKERKEQERVRVAAAQKKREAERQKIRMKEQCRVAEEARKAEERRKLVTQKKSREKQLQKATPPKEELPVASEDIDEKIVDLEKRIVEVEETASVQDYNEETGGDDSSEEVVTLGEDADGGELSRDVAALMHALERVWRPPRGLSAHLAVSARVTLGGKGTVTEVVLEKESGVLAFDMAARAALWRVTYPTGFWGKSIIIVFGGTSKK